MHCWQAFHRMRNLPSPFSAPLVQQARQKARRANARPRTPKSPKPVTRDILEALSRGDGPARVLVALGYAGWEAGQLEDELAQNSWLTVPVDRGIVFDTMLASYVLDATATRHNSSPPAFRSTAP